MSLLFGNLTQDFVGFQSALTPNTSPASFAAARTKFMHDASANAAGFCYIGLGMIIATYIYMFVWVYTAEVNAKRIRERYLQAVLRQDVAFFDNVGSGEIATRIETDTHLVQQGMSEKVALVVNFIAAFFTGFILAYARNWRLALALSSIIPVIGITGAVMNRFISRYMQYVMTFGSSGDLANRTQAFA
jgi:ATP-binding cassette subfamily B (MDR/TAP) protein 1